MSETGVPDPPDVESIDPQLMTASELQSQLEQLFNWLQLVEAQSEDDATTGFDDSAVQTVRDAANALLRERRERHADEQAPRGG